MDMEHQDMDTMRMKTSNFLSPIILILRFLS